jgi:L-fucose isomerase-like protein
MYALQLASETPSAIVDWNNNYGDDPDKAVLFHCSNFPKSLLQNPQMSFQDILAGTVGKENTFGACIGRIKPGPMTFLRITTDDRGGRIRAYVGEGEITADSRETCGGGGVVRINNLQRLLRHITENGFEHHVTVVHGHIAEVLEEAIEKYLGWEVYRHNHPGTA